MNKPVAFFLLALSLSLFTAVTNAQNIFSKMEIEFPGELMPQISHITTLDGGSMVLTESSLSAATRITMIKLDSAGNMQWHKRFGSGAFRCNNIVQSPVDSGYFFSLMENVNGYYQVIKTDKSGNVLFTRKLTLPAGYVALKPGTALARNNRSFYVASTAMDMNTYIYYWHLFGIDQNGNVTLSHFYGADFAKSFVTALDTCTNGDVMMVGDYVIYPSGNLQVAALRAAPTGNVVWFKGFAVSWPSVRPMALTRASGDFFHIVAPVIGGSLSGQRYFTMLKIDGAGNLIWDKAYHNPTLIMSAADIMRVDNGDFVVSGESFVLRTDSAGLPQCAYHDSDIKWNSVDTLSGSVLSFTGWNNWTSEGFYMTTDTCGAGCTDSAFVVTVTPLLPTDTVLAGDTPVAMINTPVVMGTDLSTIHFPELCSIMLSVHEQSNAAVSVYPNPADDIISVNTTRTSCRIELMDVNGNTVLAINSNGPVISLDVSGIANGLYILRLSTNDSVSLQKIIVTHH
jgi:hypothetical protein